MGDNKRCEFMKKITIIFTVLFLMFSMSGCKPNTPISNKPKTILTVAETDSTSTNPSYAINILVSFYNSKLPVGTDNSLFYVSANFEKKDVGAFLKKNENVGCVLAVDTTGKINAESQYICKLAFADTRLSQPINSVQGGIIETFKTSDDAKSHKSDLIKEVKGNYAYQNGVDLLGLSPLLSEKQAEEYKTVFTGLKIQPFLS